MNAEKYFLNDEYNSVNEHAEFDLDDLLSDEEPKKQSNKEKIKDKTTKLDNEDYDDIEEIEEVDEEEIIISEVKPKRKSLFGRKK